jgi:hypothetical protein
VLTTLFFVLVGFTIWIWPSRLMTASIPSLVLFLLHICHCRLKNLLCSCV